MTSLSHKDNRVLILAFHFPPQIGSSGLLRTLKFSRYLPEFDWEPLVVTANLRAYESVDPSGDKSVPAELQVIRAQAWDTKRHLGFRGRYASWMALPDRWSSWVLGAVGSSLRAMRQRRVDVLFTTFPIASAILAGLILHRLTGKPWVVDFRDSMTEEGYPRDPRAWRLWRWIERQAVRHASRFCFTTRATLEMYLKRYPELTPDRCMLISNGFDEEDFTSLRLQHARLEKKPGPLRLLHTGLIYPEERDPRPFFSALGRLKANGQIGASSLTIAFRAPGSESLYRQIIADHGIGDLLELQPHIPYHQALQECADADGLLLFQAANCDHQIPAKAYEYLRVKRPIFALTSYSGTTAALLTEVGGATIANIADEQDIYEKLPAFLDAIRSQAHPLSDPDKIQLYARRSQAKQLAACLSELKARSGFRRAEGARTTRAAT